MKIFLVVCLAMIGLFLGALLSALIGHWTGSIVLQFVIALVWGWCVGGFIAKWWAKQW